MIGRFSVLKNTRSCRFVKTNICKIREMSFMNAWFFFKLFPVVTVLRVVLLLVTCRLLSFIKSWVDKAGLKKIVHLPSPNPGFTSRVSRSRFF